MKVEDSLIQNMEEISQGNPGELTKIFQSFSTELEDIFQENSHRPEPTEEDFSMRSESIGESRSIKTEEVIYHVIMNPPVPYRTKFRWTKISADKIFGTYLKFRQFCPTKIFHGFLVYLPYNIIILVNLLILVTWDALLHVWMLVDIRLFFILLN